MKRSDNALQSERTESAYLDKLGTIELEGDRLLIVEDLWVDVLRRLERTKIRKCKVVHEHVAKFGDAERWRTLHGLALALSRALFLVIGNRGGFRDGHFGFDGEGIRNS